MRLRHVLIYAGLLVVALIASYATWTHEPPGGKGDVVVVDSNRGNLQHVVYEQEDLRVHVEGRQGDQGEYCWGHTRKEKNAPKKPQKKDEEDGAAEGENDTESDPESETESESEIETESESESESESDPESEDEDDTEPEKIIEEKTFRGNETCDRVIDRFTPMKALREFEDLAEEKLAEMGLAEPEASLMVTTDKGERTFDVGERSYGNNDYYIQDRSSGTVYLVESRMIGDMKGGHTRLMERNLQSFKKEEVESAVFLIGQQSREFVHQNRDDKKNAYWADPADTTRTADAADSWLDRVFRLRALDYFSEPPASLQPHLRLVFRDAGKDIGFMEFATALDEEGETIYLARTGNTVQWVTVSDTTGSRLVDELGEVMGPADE